MLAPQAQRKWCPLMRSDSQTLSVTQTDAVSFCEEALRVELRCGFSEWDTSA